MSEQPRKRHKVSRRDSLSSTPRKRRKVSRRDSLSSTLESDVTTVKNSQKGTALTAMCYDACSSGTAQGDNSPQDNESLDIVNTPNASSPVDTESNIHPHSSSPSSSVAELAVGTAATSSTYETLSNAESSNDALRGVAPPLYYKPNMRPIDVCDHCWTEVFPTWFGLRDFRMSPSKTGWYDGATYQVSHGQLLACERSGCMWYRCLGEEIFGEMLRWFEGQSPAMMRVTIGAPRTLGDSQCADEELIVVIDNKRDFRLSIKDNPETAWIRDWAGTVHVTIPDALAWAKARAEECSRGHVECQEFFDWAQLEASLPARLIDCSDPLRPRIVDTGALDPQVQYVALSYVWGGEQPNRTTIENLPTYQKTIDLALLPKTAG
ncbi:hypothetical protein ONZ51_g5288 [Trametes cubensis]|uniref:Heterokaryon incompatibility domain-containing protein n=1 Tax=Trametes cubensis TaxID=1111947 RepID=A0AAD7TUN0_9APHY|nr:hypothetical protein ONZ51_g5288 [Trametes cubensis]